MNTAENKNQARINRSFDYLMFGGKKLQYYDGLLIKADNYLHDQVYNVIEDILKDIKADRSSLLAFDIACGEGAFAKRLLDNGIKVECADIDENSFRYKDLMKLYCLDINSQGFQKFAMENCGRYDIIISMETIEHIENPWSFLRGLQLLCKPGGYIIVTTPNIESPYSKTFFLFKNKFNSFTEESFETIGHINPISEFEIKTIAQSLKLKLLKIIGGGKYPLLWFTFDVKRSIPWTIINILLLPFSKKRNLSWCKLYIMKNTENRIQKTE